ncbi:MAG: glycosyl hydrolase [Oscillospiraceae bacterium]
MRLKKFTAVLCVSALLLSGCSRIPAKQISLTQSPHETTEPTEEAYFAEVSAKEYEINRMEISVKLNAEGGVFEGNIRTDGDYDGNGYIVLDKGMTLKHIASMDSAQHYRMTLAAHSYGGAVIRLKLSNESAGTYYIPACESADFELFSVDNLYLPAGPSVVELEVISGSAALDYILVESSDRVKGDCYEISRRMAGSDSSVAAIGLMRYLCDTYGSSILTSQNVTPGTNAEIDMIFSETGRYPAIRTGELVYNTSAKSSEQKTAQSELEAALEWGKSGGIVSFMWHWSAPEKGGVFSEDTTFLLEDAVTEKTISVYDEAGLDRLLANGEITKECRALMRDIDEIAKALAQFKNANIPVIFQPLPFGETNLYWWGGNADNYKWLWQLIFDRLNEYHRLNNIIYVWNGSSADFYPGDGLCDIIGQSIYEQSPASFAGRFSALAQLGGDTKKLMAITDCDEIPSADYMRRDYAMWLWCSVGSGECVISSDGTLSEKYTSWQRLFDSYNHKLTITKDELPNFAEYAMESD